jgi:two-component system chemotaxis sensor kinase CheA
VALGLIDRAIAGRLSDRNALMLAALPGFSTAPSVSHVSGRGVGLEVVRDTLNRLGGRLEIDSRPGGPTRICLSVPLSVAWVRALLVRSAGALYGLPLDAVRWTARYAAAGSTERFVRLDERLGTSAASCAVPAGSWAVTLESEGARTVLVVDTLAGRHDLLVRPLHAPLSSLAAYAGAALLPDGSIALVLDPAHLAEPRPNQPR